MQKLSWTDWLIFHTPLPVLAIGIFVLAVIAYLAGCAVHDRKAPARAAAKANDPDADNYDGYIVSGVVGLLALLLGFTFGLAVDRYDTRRGLVLAEANAIGTTYLRAQTFGEPYRSELSRLLVSYADLRLITAKSTDEAQVLSLLAETDKLHERLWATTIAAVAPLRDDIAAAFIETMNETIDDAEARKAARLAHVPSRVFSVLLVYMLATAGMLGSVIGRQRRGAVIMLLALLTVSYMLIIDIDSPTRGRVNEGQIPMEDVKAFMAAHPPASFGTPAVAAK